MARLVLDPESADDRTVAPWHDLHRVLEQEEALGDQPMGLEQLMLGACHPRPEEDMTRFATASTSCPSPPSSAGSANRVRGS